MEFADDIITIFVYRNEHEDMFEVWQSKETLQYVDMWIFKSG